MQLHRKSGIALLVLIATTSDAQNISKQDFRTDRHPRVLVTADEKQVVLDKIKSVSWAEALCQSLHEEVDPIIALHEKDPGYVISRMQMHWEPGKRYTQFYTEGNFITRREGDAKYPTVRLTYARSAAGSVPPAPLDKLFAYGDGSLPKRKSVPQGIYKITGAGDNTLSALGQTDEWETIPFEKTGLGTETVNRTFIHLAWKSSILYYLTSDKRYAKLSADIIWTFARGAAQQEQVNPDYETREGKHSSNGYLSFETLGDGRHFSTLPLAYDMIYDYLHSEYFNLAQFTQGIAGEMWAPVHPEGKEWAFRQFEIMFKRLIENKLDRGGALHGNWNIHEHQSAMLYALALDNNETYPDGKGREYYVDKLIYGPTTSTHGAYVDVLRANISPTTGLWPEAPASYGQGSISQLVRFGYIYYKNGIDLLSKDPLLQKAAGSTTEMLFPNGYVTNFGDASYTHMNSEQIEFMLAYAHDKADRSQEQHLSALMNYIPERELQNEFYFSLFYFLPEIPRSETAPQFARTSCSDVYSLVFERNNADDPRNALAFVLSGYGKETGHRQPNGMNMELYGRGHVLAPDQGIGQDYWSKDTHEYKVNVAGHNTVSPNGKGADNNMPQHLEIIHAEPAVHDGQAPVVELSPNHQFVDAMNRFYTKELKADQRRLLSIVRTSPTSGYFVDIFRSEVIDGVNNYHDYIYHNMGTGFDMLDADGCLLPMSGTPLDTLSGKGYMYFETVGSLKTDRDFGADFYLGADDTHMRMFMLGHKDREVYQLNSLFNHRYYLPALRNLPVPAVLVRQHGEAGRTPFVAVYEPYGNGAEATVRRVVQQATKTQPGVVKFTVEHKAGGRMDHILNALTPDTEMEYSGIRFKGVYGVASLTQQKLHSFYVGSGTYLKIKGLEVSSVSGEPFHAYFEIQDGRLAYQSDRELNIKTSYRMK